MGDRRRKVQVDTVVLERGLPSGSFTVQPVVDGGVLAFGTEAEAHAQLKVYLAETLGKLAPERAARYFLPAGVEVTAIVVPLDVGHPTRSRAPRPVAITVVLVPQGADRWGFVPALGASFFVGRREDTIEVASREIARVVAAREMGGDDWRRLLPPLEVDAVALTLDVELGADGEAAAATARARRELRREQAEETLAELAQPLAARVRGGAPALVGRDRELAALTALLGGKDRLSVLITGDDSVGKTALVSAWALAHPGRQAWVTSTSALVAGAAGFGEAEARMIRLFAAAKALDAVLYLEDFGGLFRERGGDGGVDAVGVVRQRVVDGSVRVIGEITPLALDRAERRDVGLIGAMTRLAVPAMDAAGALAAVTAHAAHWRRAEARRPQVGPAALAVAVELARRYLPYRAFPGKAVRLLEELRAAHEGAVDERGVGAELLPEQVYDGFAAATGVPTFLLRDDRALDVDELIARLGKRMIGQAQAVRRVAETLCTVKAQLQPPDKPLATFLFVGPTGVGKTELARSLAHLLFGKDDRLVRFDMSEYADPWAAERLVRGSDAGDGLLTARIREQPFSVVLLDEIEKAHPAVHDLLLQVAGEGRLTDARGRTSWFHNAIIILTSNLGAHHGGTSVGLRTATPTGRDAELARYRAAVAAAFRPELQNRFDAVIAFHGLDRAEVAAVARLQLERLADRRGLVQLQVGLDVSPAALAALAAGGTHASYGVRALRRHLDEQVVRPAARLLARAGADGHGGVVVVRIADEPLGLDLPAGAHLATLTGAAPADGPAIAVGLWRRGGGGVRRRAHGPAQLSALRRDADVWMHRDLVTEVREQRTWLLAQLAHGDAQGGRGRPGKKRRAALSAEQRLQMATELHRLDGALVAAEAAVDELGAAEELAIDAALAGQDTAELTAMVDGLRARFETAMFRVAVARLERRDEIMLMLSAPELGVPLTRWLRAVLAVAPTRRWAITAHAMAARDPAGPWPRSPGWGPPRTVEWLAGQLEGDGPRNLLLRVRGPDAALLLGLEVGAHRFHGIARVDPCHLIVRVLAFAFDLDDAGWARIGGLATPAPAPRGEVERVYPAADHLKLGGERIDLPFAEQFARYPELGLAVIARALAADRSVAELYGSELDALVAADAAAATPGTAEDDA